VYIRSQQAGFSLFELILVIVLLGIMAGGAGLLITTPIDAYNDQVRRQLLVDQAEMALRQIARDVRRALPNSIRTTPVGAGWALEMVNTVDGARYRDEFGGLFITDDDILDFTSTSPGDVKFNFLGRLNITALTADHRLVVYNTASADGTPNIYSDAEFGDLGVMTPIGTTLSLSDAPAGAQEHRLTLSAGFQFSQQSPGQRAFIVDGPISYVCDTSTGRITRYSGYAYMSGQPMAPGGSSGPVVTKVTACSLNYAAGTAQRGGILTLELTVSDSGESVSLLHQIHVENVP
jgi:MSHA biogenesis protein MshO